MSKRKVSSTGRRAGHVGELGGVKLPSLGDVLKFDGEGDSIGFREDKTNSPEVRTAAMNEMLGMQANRQWADYMAKLSAVSDEPLMILSDRDQELARMVKEGRATAEEFNAWRRAISSGLTPLLPSDVACELYDRMKARYSKGVDRTICPEGMTDLEHAILVAENFGSKGGKAKAENEKARKRAKVAASKDPRHTALAAFRKANPDATKPEAARHLLGPEPDSMNRRAVVAYREAVRSMGRWIGREVKKGVTNSFAPGSSGRPRSLGG